MEIELEQEINQVLQECRVNHYVISHFDISKLRRNAIQEAKTFGLIQHSNAHSYELTQEGLKALELGGISEYLKDLKLKESREESIKDLTFEQLKSSIFQIKYWWIILIISGVIGFITGNFELIIEWFK
jgi:hypothetical protein